MGRGAASLLLLLLACEASVNGYSPPSTDARPSDGTQSTGDADTDAPVNVACPNGRKLYLEFEGVALTDAATSDATQNRASWMTIANGAAPRYKTNDGNRAQLIQSIVTGVRAQLTPYPIEVVTTRPASGPYMMVVFGGVASNVGSRFGGGVQELDCGDTTLNDVAWISDNVPAPQQVTNVVMGAIGFGLGLTATTDPLGCMCSWDNGCQANGTVPCRLSASIARDPNANQRCPGLTTQDEVAAFATGFCQ